MFIHVLKRFIHVWIYVCGGLLQALIPIPRGTEGTGDDRWCLAQRQRLVLKMRLLRRCGPSTSPPALTHFFSFTLLDLRCSSLCAAGLDPPLGPALLSAPTTEPAGRRPNSPPPQWLQRFQTSARAAAPPRCCCCPPQRASLRST